MSIELFVSFVAKELDCIPSELTPTRGNPLEIPRLLWPFLEMFMGEDARPIRERPYRAEAAGEVDAFLEALEAEGPPQSLASMDAARVLLERVEQAIVVATANAAAGELVILPPAVLPGPSREIAAALLWLHRMELPFAPGTCRTSG